MLVMDVAGSKVLEHLLLVFISLQPTNIIKNMYASNHF
jgi:hypothetical protein